MTKTYRNILLAALAVLFVVQAVRLPMAAQAQTTDPVLVGAGDIVTCNGTADDLTARLLDNISGTVYTLGDNVYPDGTAQQFSDCYGPTWGRHKDRTKPAVGNHDYHVTGAAGYYGYFGEAASPLDNNCTGGCKGYYSYNLGAWHIIVLNTEIPMNKGSAQEQWLRSDLAANRNTCTLSYFHAPRFSSALHGDAVKTQAVWEALYQYGADVVLNGHDHSYERFAPQNPQGVADPKGIRQFVVGTGGGKLYGWTEIKANSEARNNTDHGVLKLTLHPTSYDWEFVPVAGKTYRDSGSANCVGGGSTPVATATPQPPIATATPAGSLLEPIFSSSFETGDFSAWTSNTSDGGDLKLTEAAAMKGTFGMQAVIDDNYSIFVTDDTPNAERQYRARVYFDPNSINMTSGNAFHILTAFKGSAAAAVRVEFRRYGGSYQIRGRVINDNSSWSSTAWFTISDQSHYIEFNWMAASGASANDGKLKLWIDGVEKASLTNIDNDTWRIDRARVGAVGGVDSGTRGSVFLDAFASSRYVYIGP
jgi:hypothetical protein